MRMKQVLILVVVIAVAVLLIVALPVVEDNLQVDPGSPRVDEPKTEAPLEEEVHEQKLDGQPDMYRWRGSDGNWQVGQVPPVGVEAEPVVITPGSLESAEEFKQGKD